MLAATTKLGLLARFLAVLTTVLSVRTVLWDHWQLGWAHLFVSAMSESPRDHSTPLYGGSQRLRQQGKCCSTLSPSLGPKAWRDASEEFKGPRAPDWRSLSRSRAQTSAVLTADLRWRAEKSRIRWFRFPEFLQPSRGILRALASAPRQSLRHWSVMFLGSPAEIIPFKRSLEWSATPTNRCRGWHSREAPVDSRGPVAEMTGTAKA
jgi:hypothetical protein